MKNINNIINETIKDFLLEYSNEKHLPFEEDEFKNKNYLEQYTDWLEDFGKYGTLPSSKLNFWQELKKAIKYILENNLHGRFDIGLNGQNQEEIFNDLKNRLFDKYLIINEAGNVYVERQIVLGKEFLPFLYDVSTSDNEDPMTLYNMLVDKYNHNVGGCWSYRKDNAYSYCTHEAGTKITFKGYIRCEDIDFVKTVLLNYHYEREHEIRVKPNAKIELFEVDVNCKYKIPLRGHLIVNVTYFGNNEQYKGDYALVDDGFGSYNLMDRQGNIKKVADIIKNKIDNNIPITEIFHDIKEINEIFRCGIYYKYMFLIDWNNNVIGNGSLYFDGIVKFTDEYVAVMKDKKMTLIRPDGNFIYNGNLWFDKIYYLKEGYSRVEKDEKSSFINRRGKLIGDGNLWFDDAFDFNNGFAEVKLKNKVSLLNKEGNLINNGKIWFDFIRGFKDGFAIVTLNNKQSYIDSNGNLFWDGKIWLDIAYDFSKDNFALVSLKGQYYYIDTNGNFYTRKEKEPIPSPINENKLSKTIINEDILMKLVKETLIILKK